jgi:hypothetical protein
MSSGFCVNVNDRLTDISELKVAELKVELKKRGISTTGNKQELFDKLRNVFIKARYFQDDL